MPIDDITLTAGEAFDLLPDALILIDSAGAVAFANAAVARVLGYAPVELIGQPLDKLIPQRHRARHQQIVACFGSGGLPAVMSERPALPALHRSGEEVPVSIALAKVELSGLPFSIAVIRDASPVRDRLGEATARAESDALTGLGNRSCLSRRMQSALQSGRSFGVLFLDLTRFKPFNDRYGHAVGDEVLKLVAKRLKALVRVDDVAARLGGDEFVVLLDGLTDAHGLQARASAVAHHLEKPFHAGGVNATIGVNIGGALSPRDGVSEDDLLAVADRNMYRAKQAGHTHCCHPAI